MTPNNGFDSLCLFCGQNLSERLDPIDRHVGRHMEEIAFSVLTKPYDDWSFYSDSSSGKALKYVRAPGSSGLAPNGRSSYQCDIVKRSSGDECGVSFPSAMDFRHHLEASHSMQCTCPGCGETGMQSWRYAGLWEFAGPYCKCGSSSSITLCPFCNSGIPCASRERDQELRYHVYLEHPDNRWLYTSILRRRIK